MRFYPVFAAGLSLIVAAVAVWQVVESSNDLDDVSPYSPVGTPSGGVIEIGIETGMSPHDIGEQLEDAGIIASAPQFNILVSLLGYEGILQAGEYEFQAGSPVLSVVYRIRRGETSTRSVTVVEGWRLEEIADAVGEQGISRDEFLAEARARNFALSAARPDGFEFLQDAGRNASLEGYLYPATYSIRKDDTVQTVLEKMLQTFGNNLTPDIEPSARALGLTLDDVVTLASIIEREAVVPEERPIIAQVFLSRLRQRMSLDADPTVQYAIAKDPDSVRRYGYWKQELTRADLEYDSPYNTYANRGLPPGPICSPRLESLEAVVHPATTNYLYFVAKGDGSHAFAATLDEHLENVEKYRQDQ
jgi:UPF0755 protein